ncbi:MAG: S8 family serine peptidase, partial [Phycisphaerales bacterium]|nr:S8 family serine peptidase [Phycisphaerales bacterium]
AIASQYAATRERGLVHVAPTGFDGRDSVGLPARLPSVIGVGAADRTGAGMAPQSNRGAAVDGAAPGLGVITLAPGHGTVMQDGATPAAGYAAGVLALALSVDADLSPADLEALLTLSARDLGVPGRDPASGAGLVDAWRMLRHAGVPGDANSDGTVNMIDLEIVLDAWGLHGASPADVTLDDQVNFADLGLVLDMMSAP